MYKTRGKPEDPWNLVALEQEKGLAAAIHVNQIRQNGLAPQETSNPAQRQELARRRQNYQEFREAYHNRIKKPTVCHGSSRSITRPELKDYSHDVQIMKRFVGSRVNDRRSNDDTKGRHKPAMLRAPLRTVKTIKVEVPARYKEEAIFCPPKFGEGESLAVCQKLKESEQFKDQPNTSTAGEENVQTDLAKKVQEANFEADISNVQLEEIKKILQATKSQTADKKEEEALQGQDKVRDTNNSKQYNVQIASNQKKLTAHKVIEKEEGANKSKLLLTLNDVHQKIQKMQIKFFGENRPRYRSVRSVFRANKNQKVEVLYKNTNYTRPQTAMPGRYSKLTRNRDSLKKQPQNENYIRPHTTKGPYEKEPAIYTQQVPVKGLKTQQTQNYGADEINLYNSTKLPRSGRNSPRFIEIPHLNIAGDHPGIDELLLMNQYDAINNTGMEQYNNPTVFIDDGSKKEPYENFRGMQGNAKDYTEGIDMELALKLKLQDSILKSDYLMKELDINPKDMHFDMNKVPPKLENKRTSKWNVELPRMPVHKYGRGGTQDYRNRARNRELYTHSILKNTLYCADKD